MRITKPKGTLIAIGGGDGGQDILDRILKETGRRAPKICYITVATTYVDDAKEMHKDFYKDLGKDVGRKGISIIHFDARCDADSDENMEKIKKCNAVFIGGGNQLRLTSLLGGTLLLEEIKRRYYDEDNFVVAGSSAGASAMSSTMIISGENRDALFKGGLQLTNGLDFINNVFIDTHFTERGRFGRLVQTVAYNPGILGLGLSIDTAAIINGEALEIIGSGLAVIVDGTLIEYSNLTEVSDGDALTIEGLKVHILGPGHRFLLDQRKIRKKLIRKKH